MPRTTTTTTTATPTTTPAPLVPDETPRRIESSPGINSARPLGERPQFSNFPPNFNPITTARPKLPNFCKLITCAERSFSHICCRSTEPKVPPTSTLAPFTPSSTSEATTTTKSTTTTTTTTQSTSTTTTTQSTTTTTT